MYGVLVCPRCKRAKGVNLKQKTTTCQCGFEIHVVPARIRARAETARELAPLVGKVSAELAGGTEELELFSLSDWERVLAGLGIPHPDEALATLVEENTVFEPKAGFFRAVVLNP
jgi:hypothetical protein